MSPNGPAESAESGRAVNVNQWLLKWTLDSTAYLGAVRKKEAVGMAAG